MTYTARAALESARLAAHEARVNPGNDAATVARHAIANAVHMLHADVRMDGAGYNPYRDNGGKFAPGPHAKKPGAGERAAAIAAARTERAAAKVGRAKDRLNAVSERLAKAKAARLEAVSGARDALKSAKSAAALAKKSPTQKNLNAARVATNKATRAVAKVDKHTAAVAKHTEAHAAAKAAHAEARTTHAAVAKQSKPGPRSGRVTPKEPAAPKDTAGKAAEHSASTHEPAGAGVGHGESTRAATSAHLQVQPSAIVDARPMNSDHFESMRTEFRTHLSEAEIAAAQKYSTTAYTSINDRLRRGVSPDHEDDSFSRSDMAGHLDTMIGKSSMPHDTIVLRGAHGKELRDHYASMKPGDVFQEKAYTSTTAHAEIHDQFQGNVEMRITLPKGAQGAAIPTAKPFEREILLPRGQKFRVDKTEERVEEHEFRPTKRTLVVHVTAV